jgi:hypothetical protein
MISRSLFCQYVSRDDAVVTVKIALIARDNKLILSTNTPGPALLFALDFAGSIALVEKTQQFCRLSVNIAAFSFIINYSA